MSAPRSVEKQARCALVTGHSAQHPKIAKHIYTLVQTKRCPRRGNKNRETPQSISTPWHRHKTGAEDGTNVTYPEQREAVGGSGGVEEVVLARGDKPVALQSQRIWNGHNEVEKRC